MNQLSTLQHIAIWALPVLFAITIHEVAHGWVANKLGDPTARMLGRLTLNPVKHIDLIGTIIVPGLLLILGGFIFGWAKPVPITWQNLKNPRRDIALVALAGPGSNFLMALIWGAIAKMGMMLGPSTSMTATLIVYMGFAGISINLVLMTLNLIPIPPLDGSRVVSVFLKGRIAIAYSRIEQFGFWILLALIFTGVLSYIMLPPLHFLQGLILNLFGMSRGA